MSFLQFVSPMRALQESLMTDRCTVSRHGVTIQADIPCRVHKDRLFSEPGDPQDANLRSTQEWGVTMPANTAVNVGDDVIFATFNRDISIIVGEVLQGDTWEIATRVWGTEPKVATPEVTVTLWRYDPNIDEWAEEGDVTGNIIYDRNQPEEAPVRYSPAGQAMYKNGALIVPLDSDPMPTTGDRFDLLGYSAAVTMVLPAQPQHVEARFRLDISGDRTG
jgi:hypothetical protein